METYQLQKARHSKEFGDIKGMFFAFSQSQLAEGLQKVGLSPEPESHKLIASIGGGGYILKTSIPEFEATLERHAKERAALRKDKKELLAALVYELDNHEYCITGDPTEALDVLGYTRETIPADILKAAIKQCSRG